MGIVQKHKEKCIYRGSTGALWMGARKVNNSWYELNSKDALGIKINYTNWFENSEYYANLQCTYLHTDGRWHVGFQLECDFYTLCTICRITRTPVFTVKGQCYKSGIDFNYYLVVDKMNQVHSFEGYKDTEIIYNKESNSWRFYEKNEKSRRVV